jgi:hypothetical protein
LCVFSVRRSFYDESGWLEVRKPYCSMAYSGSIGIKFHDIYCISLAVCKKIKIAKPFST